MFEGIVYQLLANYLEHYVKDLQRERLRVGLWSGVVVLENIELRLEALDFLLLPCAVKHGSVGRLQLRIPWNKLRREPLVLTLEDVVLRCGPRDDWEWEEGPSVKREQEAKKSQLASAEIAQLSHQVTGSSSKSRSFLSAFWSRILDNVQLSVYNVHIRYEDARTCPERPFAFGLTLAQLTARTSDGSGRVANVPASFVHKLIDIKTLGLYWESLQPNDELKSLPLGSMDESWTEVIGSRIPVLAPVDVSVRITWNRTDGLGQYPSVLVVLDSLSCMLEDRQYRDVLLLSDALSVCKLYQRYARYRAPTWYTREEGWQSDAWRYAIQATLHDVRPDFQRQRKDYMVQRAKTAVRYVKLYGTKLEELRRGQQLPAPETGKLYEMECMLPFEDVVLLRSVAEEQVKQPSKTLFSPTPDSKQSRGWVSWLTLGVLAPSDHSSTASDNSHILDISALEQDFQVLYDEMDDSVLAEDTTMWSPQSSKPQATAITCRAKSMTVTLCRSIDNESIIRFSLERIKWSGQLQGELLNARLSVGLVSAEDLSTPGTLYGYVLQPRSWSESAPSSPSSSRNSSRSGRSGRQSHKQESKQPLLEISIESHEKELTTLQVHFRPVELVYSTTCVTGLVAFFTPPMVTYQDYLLDAINSLRPPDVVAESKLRLALQSSHTLSLNIQLDSPMVLFPASTHAVHSTVLALIIGSMSVSKSNQRLPAHGASHLGAGQIDQLLEKVVFSRYAVIANHTQVLILQQGDELLDGSFEDLMLAGPVDLVSEVKVSNFVSDNSLTSVMITGKVPAGQRLMLHLPPAHCARLAAYFQAPAEAVDASAWRLSSAVAVPTRQTCEAPVNTMVIDTATPASLVVEVVLPEVVVDTEIPGVYSSEDVPLSLCLRTVQTRVALRTAVQQFQLDIDSIQVTNASRSEDTAMRTLLSVGNLASSSTGPAATLAYTTLQSPSLVHVHDIAIHAYLSGLICRLSPSMIVACSRLVTLATAPATASAPQSPPQESPVQELPTTTPRTPDHTARWLGLPPTESVSELRPWRGTAYRPLASQRSTDYSGSFFTANSTGTGSDYQTPLAHMESQGSGQFFTPIQGPEAADDSLDNIPPLALCAMPSPRPPPNPTLLGTLSVSVSSQQLSTYLHRDDGGNVAALHVPSAIMQLQKSATEGRYKCFGEMTGMLVSCHAVQRKAWDIVFGASHDEPAMACSFRATMEPGIMGEGHAADASVSCAHARFMCWTEHIQLLVDYVQDIQYAFLQPTTELAEPLQQDRSVPVVYGSPDGGELSAWYEARASFTGDDASPLPSWHEADLSSTPVIAPEAVPPATPLLLSFMLKTVVSDFAMIVPTTAAALHPNVIVGIERADVTVTSCAVNGDGFDDADQSAKPWISAHVDGLALSVLDENGVSAGQLHGWHHHVIERTSAEVCIGIVEDVQDWRVSIPDMAVYASGADIATMADILSSNLRHWPSGGALKADVQRRRCDFALASLAFHYAAVVPQSQELSIVQLAASDIKSTVTIHLEETAQTRANLFMRHAECRYANQKEEAAGHFVGLATIGSAQHPQGVHAQLSQQQQQMVVEVLNDGTVSMELVLQGVSAIVYPLLWSKAERVLHDFVSIRQTSSSQHAANNPIRLHLMARGCEVILPDRHSHDKRSKSKRRRLSFSVPKQDVLVLAFAVELNATSSGSRSSLTCMISPFELSIDRRRLTPQPAATFPVSSQNEKQLILRAAQMLCTLESQPKAVLSLSLPLVTAYCTYRMVRFFMRFPWSRSAAAPVVSGAEKAMERAVASQDHPWLHSVHLELIRGAVLFVDDRWNGEVPLAELLIEDFTVEAEQNADAVTARVSALIQAQYRNNEKVAWEPIVERFRLTVFCKGNKGISHLQSNEARVAVDMQADLLNINLTAALAESLAWVAETLLDSLSRSQGAMTSSAYEPLPDRQHSPYVLVNQTGVPVSYWTEGVTDQRSSVSGVLQSGSAVPLFANSGAILRGTYESGLAGEDTQAARAYLSRHQAIRVQLDGADSLSPPLSLDMLGHTTFQFTISRGGRSSAAHNGTGASHAVQDVTVLCEVECWRHSKRFVLHSTVCMVNKASVPIELLFSTTSPTAKSSTFQVPPNGGKIWFPVYMIAAQLRWRPIGRAFHWSLPISLVQLIQSSVYNQPMVTACPSEQPHGALFECCVSLDQEVPTASRLSTEVDSPMRPITCITVWPPLTLENNLPEPLEASIDTASTHTLAHVPAGGTAVVYEVDTLQPVQIAFRLHGVWSDHVRLPTAKSVANTEPRGDRGEDSPLVASKLSLQTAGGTSVVIDLEATSVASAARFVCITCPFILYNGTGLSLGLCDPIDSAMHEILLPAVNARHLRNSAASPMLDSPKHEYVGLAEVLSIARAPSADRIIDLPQRIESNSVVKDMPRAARRVEPVGLAVALMPSQSRVVPGISKLRTEPFDVKAFVPGSSIEQPGIEVPVDTLTCGLMYSPKSTRTDEPMLKLRLLQDEIDKDSWSQPFGLEPAGGLGVVYVPSNKHQGVFAFAVSTAPKFNGRTKVVAVQPRYVVVNATQKGLCYKQQGSEVYHRLPAGARHQFHWRSTSRNFLISIRLDEHGWLWSGGFAPDRLGETQVKIRHTSNRTIRVVRVDVSTPQRTSAPTSATGSGMGTCVVVITDHEPGFTPYRIDNHSSVTIRFKQKNVNTLEDTLAPYSSCAYAWDEPCFPHRLLVEAVGHGMLGTFQLDEVAEYSSDIFPTTLQRHEKKLQISVIAEGPTRVLAFTDARRHDLPASYNAVGGMTALGQMRVAMHIHITTLGLSVIEDTPQELLYASMSDVTFTYARGELEHAYDVTVQALQLDNQLRNATFPVVLTGEGSSSPIWPRARFNWKKKRITTAPVADPIFSIRLLPIKVELEEEWVLRVLQFCQTLAQYQSTVSHLVKTWDRDGLISQLFDETDEKPSDWIDTTMKGVRSKVYIELLEISAVNATVTFASAPWLPNQSRGAAAQGLLQAVGVALQRRVMALADVEGASLRLSPLVLRHPLAGWTALQGIGARHYTRQIYKELFKVLGSADFLGNPVGLLQSLSIGMWDFVATPAWGLVQLSPRQFTRSIASGTRSLLANTVFALSNAASKISGAARKSVAALILDDSYLEEMERRTVNRNAPPNDVLGAFLIGLTGLMEQPVRGAEKGGIPGMLKGAFAGVVGVFARPALSLLELSNHTAQAFRNLARHATEMPTRVRPPRLVSLELPLQPYELHEAVGRAVIFEIKSGQFRRDTYVNCTPLAEGGHYAVLTQTHMLWVHDIACDDPTTVKIATSNTTSPKPNAISGRGWVLYWSSALEDVLSVRLDTREVVVLALRPSTVGLQEGPFVHVRLRFTEADAAQEWQRLLTAHTLDANSNRQAWQNRNAMHHLVLL
eukprot:jgi/Chlat1/9040/Chrsp94S09266